MVNEAAPKAKILIVDDIPDTVQLLKDWLESHDFDALGVTSSFEALEVAEQEHPDLILLDIMMPKMDGMETCRRLKANPKTAGIPVVIVTAKNPSDARAEGMMAGAVDYITKPVNLNDLVKRIETVLTTTSQEPADVQRLLEEVAHSALTIIPSDLVWLLGVDNDEQVLKSRILATTGGARVETEFLLTAANGQSSPKFSLSDANNPLCTTLLTRKMLVNLTTESLKERSSTEAVFRATELLRLSYLTVIPLTAAGKTPGVMVLGDLQPHNMETPRARQILTSLGTQAAIALDYSRLISDLTERENEMKREQAFRQMILDTMSDGLVVIDSKGIIKYVNRRLMRMTNYAKGFLEERSVGELFHPDDRVEVMIGLMREGIATMKFEQRLITRDNRVIPVWLTRSRVQSDDLNNQVIVLSDMTEQKLREDELERQTGRLIALNQAAHVITGNLSLHDTLNNILNSARKVVESQGASLFLINRDNPDELIVVAAVGTGADVLQGLRVPLGEGVAGFVAREAKSQLVGDIKQEPHFYKGVDEKTGMNTRSLIAAPLINADKVIGVIEVVNKLNNEMFTQDDVRLLESMAGTAAVSIVNARLFDETQRRVHELGTLLNASGAASSTLRFPQVLESIARNLVSGLEVGRCVIMAWNAPKRRLESLAEFGDVSWLVADAPKRLLADDSISRLALTENLMIHASVLDTDLSPEHRNALAATGMISVIAMPFRSDDKSVGLITLYSNHSRIAFSDEDAVEIDTLVKAWSQNVPGSIIDATYDEITELTDQLLRVSPTCWVTIRAWNEGDGFTRILREKGFAEWTKNSGITLPIEHYPTMQNLIEKQEVQIVSYEDNTVDSAELKWLEYHGAKSCISVPLVERRTAVGVIRLISRDERVFDEDEVRLAKGIANVASSAMEKARLYQSLDSRARALESAYRELQEADKAKDEFIQNVSHELRTPLISVIGYGSLLQDGEFGSVTAEQQDALGIVLQKSQKLADIVEDIVSAQALETQTFDRKPVNIVEIVKTVVDKYRQRTEELGIELNIRIPENMPLVSAESKSISDAFEKILDNALKFGGNGKAIDVALQDTAGAVIQVAVRDYGIGIDPSEHTKIFRRFYQVDGGTARRFPGTGLGLAIAKAIVEGHGGRLGVKSRLNEGATFMFTIPKLTNVPE
ncbi:MAG: GAF domain-containing protein [Anaerolineae bacterium]